MGNELVKSLSSQWGRTDKIELFNQFLALCVLTTVLGVFLSGCGQPGSVNTHARDSQSQNPPVVTTSENPQPENEETETPQRPTVDKEKIIEVTETNQADVIVVIDNSASMRFEQANMAQRFSSLLDGMKGLDWTLGIITTDVSEDAPKKDGRFLEFAGLPGVFHLSSDMDEEKVKAAFGATIQRPSREGNSNEQGIKATYRALERKPDWLRANASLNVVVVTDSDETPRHGRAEIRNNPSSLLKYVKTHYPSKPFFFHSIIVKEGDSVCLKKDDNEAYGRSYAWLSQKTGGVIGDVCQKDYSHQLELIGEKVSQQIKVIELDCEPVKGSVLITNGSEEVTEFTVEGSVLRLPKALSAGQNKIQYKCYSDTP